MVDWRFKPPGPLGFGGAPLGNMFGCVDEDAAIGTLRVAWDEGIRYFDTAPLYGTGLSEHRFGRALRAYPRDEFVLSTKSPAAETKPLKQRRLRPIHRWVAL